MLSMARVRNAPSFHVNKGSDGCTNCALFTHHPLLPLPLTSVSLSLSMKFSPRLHKWRLWFNPARGQDILHRKGKLILSGTLLWCLFLCPYLCTFLIFYYSICITTVFNCFEVYSSNKLFQRLWDIPKNALPVHSNTLCLLKCSKQ